MESFIFAVVVFENEEGVSLVMTDTLCGSKYHFQTEMSGVRSVVGDEEDEGCQMKLAVAGSRHTGPDG